MPATKKNKTSLPRGIVQRGNSYRWSVMIRGERYSGSAHSLEEAVIARAKCQRGEGRATPAKATGTAGPWTLGQAYDTTAKLSPPEGWRGSKGEHTALQNAGDALAFFGRELPMADLTKGMLDSYVADLQRRGNSNGTINRKMSALHKLFSVAIRNDGLDKLPVFPRRLKEGKGRIRQISRDEELEMIGTLDNWGKYDQSDAIQVLIDTGLRTGELWALQACDVDMEGNVLVVAGVGNDGTKNGEVRSVPMTSRVRTILARRCKGLKRGDRPFPFDNNWMHATWRPLRTHMGLDDDPQFVPHVLRHTCASRLIASPDVSIPMVQQWLGHKTVTVTMRYAHLMPRALHGGLAALQQTA